MEEERERELNAVTKKKWSTPQLIVLVRGRPEEGVLTNCKMNGLGGVPGNPASAKAACEVYLGNASCYVWCGSVVGGGS